MLTDTERAALAARLRRSRLAGSAGAAGATQIPRRPAGPLAELPLSYGQEQLWFLDRFAPGLPTYNLPLALALTGPLDTAALGAAVDALTARHEALRTRLVTRRRRPPGPGDRPAAGGAAAVHGPVRPRAPGAAGAAARAASRPRRWCRSTWPPTRCCEPA